MSQSTEDRVEKVIIDLVNKKSCFTTLDITNAVKNDGGAFVRHRDMASIIHNRLQNSLPNINYDTSTIPVDNNQFATLYHPVGADISAYNTSQKALAPTDVTTSNTKHPNIGTIFWPVTQNTAPQPVAPTPVVTNTFSVKVRADGAIEIPAKLVEMITPVGPYYGCNRLDITNHPNSISLSVNALNGKFICPGMRIPKTVVAGRNFTKMTWHKSTTTIVVS